MNNQIINTNLSDFSLEKLLLKFQLHQFSNIISLYYRWRNKLFTEQRNTISDKNKHFFFKEITVHVYNSLINTDYYIFCLDSCSISNKNIKFNNFVLLKMENTHTDEKLMFQISHFELIDGSNIIINKVYFVIENINLPIFIQDFTQFKTPNQSNDYKFNFSLVISKLEFKFNSLESVMCTLLLDRLIIDKNNILLESILLYDESSSQQVLSYKGNFITGEFNDDLVLNFCSISFYSNFYFIENMKYFFEAFYIMFPKITTSKTTGKKNIVINCPSIYVELDFNYLFEDSKMFTGLFLQCSDISLLIFTNGSLDLNFLTNFGLFKEEKVYLLKFPFPVKFISMAEEITVNISQTIYFNQSYQILDNFLFLINTLFNSLGTTILPSTSKENGKNVTVNLTKIKFSMQDTLKISFIQVSYRKNIHDDSISKTEIFKLYNLKIKDLSIIKLIGGPEDDSIIDVVFLTKKNVDIYCTFRIYELRINNNFLLNLLQFANYFTHKSLIRNKMSFKNTSKMRYGIHAEILHIKILFCATEMFFKFNYIIGFNCVFTTFDYSKSFALKFNKISISQEYVTDIDSEYNFFKIVETASVILEFKKINSNIVSVDIKSNEIIELNYSIAKLKMILDLYYKILNYISDDKIKLKYNKSSPKIQYNVDLEIIKIKILKKIQDREIIVVDSTISTMSIIYHNNILKILAIMKTEFYNSISLGWESLVEPFKICFEIQFQDQYRVKFVTFDKVYFNLSFAAIETLMTIFNDFNGYQELLNEKIQLESQIPTSNNLYYFDPHSSYIIVENYTGIGLNIKLHHVSPISNTNFVSDILSTQTSNHNLTVGSQIKNNDSIPIFVSSIYKEKENFLKKKCYILPNYYAKVTNENWEKEITLPLENLGCYVHLIKSNHKIYLILCNINIENSVRKVTFSSSCEIKNCTEFILKFFLDCENEIVVLPYEKSKLPIDFIYKSIHLETGLNSFGEPKMTEINHYKNVNNETIILINSEYYINVFVERNIFLNERLKEISKSHLIPNDLFYTMLAGTINFCPYFVIHNCTPLDFCLRIFDFNEKEIYSNIVCQGCKQLPLFKITKDSKILINILMDNFIQKEILQLHINDNLYMEQNQTTENKNYVELFDNEDRSLRITFSFQFFQGSIFMFFKVPYWFINKTNIPLLVKFKLDSDIIAGQTSESEKHKDSNPLLISFSSTMNLMTFLSDEKDDDSFNLQLRIGQGFKLNYNEEYEGVLNEAVWSEPFLISKPGCYYRHLILKFAKDKIKRYFDVGITIRKAPNPYNRILVISVFPRYNFKNFTNYSLRFNQVLNNDTKVNNNQDIFSLLPNSCISFEWPKDEIVAAEYSNIMIVLQIISDSCEYFWSNPFKIDKESSFFIHNIRKDHESCLFFRINIKLKEASYIVSIYDATDYNPPFKIINESSVPIKICSYDKDINKISLNQKIDCNSVSPFMLCQPGKHIFCGIDVNNSDEQILVSVMDTPLSFISLKNINDELKELIPLTYCSLFYICIISQEKLEDMVLEMTNMFSIVVSKRKDKNMNQLWFYDQNGLIFNAAENNSFNLKDEHFENEDFILCFSDMKIQEPQTNLIMGNKFSQSNNSNRKWKINEETNEITTKFNNFNFTLSLKDGTIFIRKINVVPFNSLLVKFFKKPYLPGNGTLKIESYRKNYTCNLIFSHFLKKLNKKIKCKPVWSIDCHGSFSLSLINQTPHELMAIHCNSIDFKVEIDEINYSNMNIQVSKLQIDNKLLNRQNTVILYQDTNEPIKLEIKNMIIKNYKKIEIDLIELYIPKFIVDIDQLIILKIVQMFNVGFSQHFLFYEKKRVNNNLKKKLMMQTLSKQSLKFETEEIYSKNVFSINPTNIVVDKLIVNQHFIVLTYKPYTNNNDVQLVHLRQKLNMSSTVIQDVNLDLSQMESFYIQEDLDAFLLRFKQHFKEALKGKSAYLLLSMNALGNPMGMIKDIRLGMNSLMRDGDVTNLLVNITHGISDSFAKVTDTLATKFKRLSPMENTEIIMAQKLYNSGFNGGFDHFISGIESFGLGINTGINDMLTKPIQGATREGLPGFFSGLGSGIGSGVTKILAGTLEMTSSTFTAIRESTRPTPQIPENDRLIRTCNKLTSAFSEYDEDFVLMQHLILKLTSYDINQRLLWVSTYNYNSDDKTKKQKVACTDSFIYMLRYDGKEVKIEYKIAFNNLNSCQYVRKNYTEHYIEFSLKKISLLKRNLKTNSNQLFKSKNEHLAQNIVSHINFIQFWLNNVKNTIPLIDI